MSHSASESGAIQGAHKNISPPPLGGRGNTLLYPPSVAGGEELSAGGEATFPHDGSKSGRRAAGALAAREECVCSGGTVGGKAKQTTSPPRGVDAAKDRYAAMLDGDGDGGGGGALAAPVETFLDSLHLDRDQLSDFSNSEGHFLYLRQKPGTDATAYNLEVHRVDHLTTNIW